MIIMSEVRHRLALCVLLAVLSCGCKTLPFGRKPKAAPPPPSAPKSQPKVDARAQQAAYDRGLKLFSEEKYPEARDAWREAVRSGPKTALGQKSKENLQKVEKILENLERIQKQ